MTGSWFWWGGRHRSDEEYRRLWRFTVEYLRDVKGVHNLLWAYSTDVLTTRRPTSRSYPGDAYVDVLGSTTTRACAPGAARHARAPAARVGTLAESRGKVARLTETGWRAFPTRPGGRARCSPALAPTPRRGASRGLMVWRNAPATAQQPRHFYAPHAGHPSVRDFVRFREHPLIAFDGEFPDLYRDPPHARAPRAPGDR
jgi:mannan endo-1,4-beta-mannosidase